MGEDLTQVPGTLEWRSHPARERPLAALALAVIMLAASVLASVYGGSAWWGLVGFSLLCLSLWSFILPTSYRMDEEGVAKRSVFGTERRRWSEVRSFYTDPRGMLLSPFPGPTRLARFRGLSVQFSPENREEVIAFVRDRSVGGRSG